MKKKMFIIDWCIFPFDVLVALGSSAEDIIKELNKRKFKPDDEQKNSIVMYGNGRTVMFKGGQTLLWIKYFPKKGSGILAHEISHAVQFITDHVGIKHSEDSFELYAYMTEYLTNKINNKL